jgi:hypothetical protein
MSLGTEFSSKNGTIGISCSIISQLVSLVSPRWGDERPFDVTRGSAALHPWLACLAPLGRNSLHPWPACLAPLGRNHLSGYEKNLCRLVVAFALALTAGAISAADRVTIDLESSRSEPLSKFVVDGIPEPILRESARWTDERWQELFAVYTVQDERIAPTALLGEYGVVKGKLTFAPRYPLRAAVTYRAILRLPGNKSAEGTQSSRDFTLTEHLGPKTELTAIYPTREVLPENLLKFYLHFSAPMSRGEVYQRVRLRDDKKRLVEHPFLELAEELWSPDGKRLTLYFDPGRIKRGLKPRELFGPALLEGHSYALEVDATWPDAKGRPLSGPRLITKSFRVTAPDDQQPDAKRWKVLAPPAASRKPLTVTFDEPLDSAMLLRVILVRDNSDKEVTGEVTVGKDESSWTFQPTSDWLPGDYSLAVETTLEDLAGNSLGRPFEVDVFRPATDKADAAVTIPFTVSTQ